jgi:hypothetical protein
MSRLLPYLSTAVGSAILIVLVLILIKMPDPGAFPATVGQWEAAKAKGRAAMDEVKSRSVYVQVDNELFVHEPLEVEAFSSLPVSVENHPPVIDVKILDTNGPLPVTLE